MAHCTAPYVPVHFVAACLHPHPGISITEFATARIPRQKQLLASCIAGRPQATPGSKQMQEESEPLFHPKPGYSLPFSSLAMSPGSWQRLQSASMSIAWRVFASAVTLPVCFLARVLAIRGQPVMHVFRVK